MLIVLIGFCNSATLYLNLLRTYFFSSFGLAYRKATVVAHTLFLSKYAQSYLWFLRTHGNLLLAALIFLRKRMGQHALALIHVSFRSKYSYPLVDIPFFLAKEDSSLSFEKYSQSWLFNANVANQRRRFLPSAEFALLNEAATRRDKAVTFK